MGSKLLPTRLFANMDSHTFVIISTKFDWEEIYTPAGDWHGAFIEKS